MSAPAVSVVIPAWNRARLLPRSIGSVLRQSYSDWELIVVDDKSTDDTRRVVEDFAARDGRIRYAANARTKGPSGARNQGIDLAAGKYIALLDSDDEWVDDHLTEMVHYLETYPDRLDIMTGNQRARNVIRGVEEDLEIDLSRWRYERLEDAYLLDRDMLFSMGMRSRIYMTPTLVARREILTRHRFDEELPAAEELLLWYHLAYQKYGVGHLQKVHVVVYKHDDNLTNTNGLHSPERCIPLYLGFVNFMLKAKSTFPLSWAQRSHLNRQLAGYYFWMLAYNCYLPLGRYDDAHACMQKAILLRPWSVGFWKTYLKTRLRWAWRRLKLTGGLEKGSRSEVC